MAEKQGEIKKITQKDVSEFKGEGEEVRKGMNPPLHPSQEGDTKRTSIITMQSGRPHRIYFEDGKQVKAEPIS